MPCDHNLELNAVLDHIQESVIQKILKTKTNSFHFALLWLVYVWSVLFIFRGQVLREIQQTDLLKR